MKKYLYLVAIFFALAFSCKEKESVVPDDGEFLLSDAIVEMTVDNLSKAVKSEWKQDDRINIWFDNHYSQDTPDLVLGYQSGKWVSVQSRPGTKIKSSGTLAALYESSNNLDAMFSGTTATSSDYSAPAAKLSDKFKRNPMIMTTKLQSYSYDQSSSKLSATIGGWEYLTRFKVTVAKNEKMPKAAEYYALKICAACYPYERFGLVKDGDASTIAFDASYTGKTFFAGGVQEDDGIAFYFTEVSFDTKNVTFALREYAGDTKICTKINKKINADNPNACVGVMLDYNDFVPPLNGDIRIEDPLNGPEVDIDSPSVTSTLYYRLNAGGHTVNSHAGQTSNSTLTYVAGTYVKPGASKLNLEMPVYPRFIKTKDGRYLMFYHDGFYTESSKTSTWSGRNCYLAQSTDMKNWNFVTKIFPKQLNVESMYGDRTITRSYSGAFPARMADGRIIVVSAYMGSYDVRHRLLDNGLAVKISADEGRTWTTETRLNVGMNWEPCVVVLPEDSPHPGRVIIYYTDSCPFIDKGEDAWATDIISSGVSYVWSDDNGKTWQPQDLLNDHVHAYRYKRDENAKWKVYTDQMPGVIQLNGKHQLVGVSEANMAPCSQTTTDFYIGISYGEKDGSWGSPDADGVMPREKTYDFKGSAPAIHQFASGETVLTYNYGKQGNRFLMRLGDESAHNLGEEMMVFEHCSCGGRGFWGESLIDNHVILMGVGAYGGTAGKGYFMQIGQYYLNHNITASSYAVTVDGSYSEWKDTDEALFAGSGEKCRATIRFSVNGNKLFGLATVDASGSAESDCVDIYLSSPTSDALGAGDRWLKISANGTINSSHHTGNTWNTDTDITTYAVRKGDGYYVAEFSVPLTLLPVQNKEIKVNFALTDAVDGTQFIRPVTSSTTTDWMKIKVE